MRAGARRPNAGGGGGKRGPPMSGEKYSPYSGRGPNNNNNNRGTPPAAVKRPAFAEVLSFLPFRSGVRSAHEQLSRCSKAATYSLADSILTVESFLSDVNELSFLEPSQHTVNDKETVAAAEKGEAKVNPSLKPLNGVPGEDETCYRALIVSNIPAENKSFLNTLSLICAKNSTGTDKNPFCYGGIVSKDDPINGLKDLLVQQTGVDFSGVNSWVKICQITHEKKDRTSSYCTTYVLPDLRELPEPVVFKSLAEEHAAVEAVEATETTEKVEAKPAITTRLVTPTLVPFLTLVGTGSPGITNKSLEVNTAFQVLDEITMTTLLKEVSNFISRKATHTTAADDYRNSVKEAQEKIVQRVKELEAQRSSEIDEEIKKLKETWDTEDIGETECDREEKAPARRVTQEKTRSAIMEKYSELVAAAKAEEIGPQKEIISDADAPATAAFQYFARVIQKGKMATADEVLNTKTLMNATMAADTEGTMSLKEVREMYAKLPRNIIIKEYCSLERIVDCDVEMEEAPNCNEGDDDNNATDEPMAEQTEENSPPPTDDVEMEAVSGADDEEAIDDKYSTMTYRELQAECQNLKLAATGKKTDLLQRLREAENE